MHYGSSIGLALAVCACTSDLATRSEVEREIRRVEDRVETVDRRRVTDATEFSYDLSAASARIEWVERRQTQAEEVLEVMGDGFNVLTESIEESDNRSQRIEQRQSRLEKKIERTLKPVLSQAFERSSAGTDSIVVLLGLGEDLRTGLALAPLRLILDEPPILRRMTGEQSYVEFIPTREIGDRIYGISGGDEPNLCLDVIDRPDESVEFAAADCSDPFQVYRFQIE